MAGRGRLRAEGGLSAALTMAGLAVAIGPADAARAAVIFTPLGDLPGGTVHSKSYNVAADGSAVSGVVGVSGGFQSFRWTSAGGMQALGPAVVSASDVGGFAVANGGNVVFGADGTNFFRWTSAGGVQNLGSAAQSPVVPPSHATADGAVAVTTLATGLGVEPYQPVRWSSATGISAVPLNVVRAVAADGVTLGGQSVAASGRQAALYRAGAAWGPGGSDVKLLGGLPGGTGVGTVMDLAADGNAAAGFSRNGSGTNEAYRWTSAGGMVSLGDLPGGPVFSVARGISADGGIVVGDGSVTTFEDTAFIWDASHGMRALKSALLQDYGLNVGAWQLTQATAISDDGATIVGWGVNPSGQTEAWVVSVPEPATPLALATLTAGLLPRRRRRNRVTA